MTPDEQKEIGKRVIASMQNYAECFNSGPGRKVFRDLYKSFAINLFDPNPFVMARNVGAKEVVDRILEMIKGAKNRKLQDELLNPPQEEEF